MFKSRIMKAGVGSVVASVLFLGACGSDDNAVTKVTATQLVAQAKKDIANKDYAAALAKCLKAEEKDDTYDEAKYCVLASEMGALMQSVSAIIGLIASQVNAPAYQPQAFNVKSIVSSILSDIETQMQYIDRYSYKLAAMDNPHFQIDDFPLSLDPKDLIDLIGSSDVVVKGDLALNMKGTWDKSEVMVLGATINGVQGVLDYLLAHKLVLASTDISFDSTSGVAEFLHNNPDLLAKDATDESRLKGDGDKHKGLKNDVLAALSFLVGRASDLELVAPKNDGLVAAIKQSAAEAKSGAYKAQVVKWVDADGDGIPEAIGLPAINDLKNSIVDKDGKPYIEKDTIDNPLKKASWDAILAFGKALRDNVEKGGAPVALKAPLQAIVDDLVVDHADTRILKKPVPDMLAINPGAFFAAPKYVKEMLPYYFQYNTTKDTAKTIWELALEEEQFDVSTAISKFYVAGVTGTALQADWAHFAYPAAATLFVTPVTVMTGFTFGDFAAAPAAIAADGVTATAKTPHLYYIALQDPAIGGLLEADTAFGGAYAKVADNKVFNTGLNKLLKYYCLDFNTEDAAGDTGFTQPFDDTLYPATNKIADCH
jgi:hypothetical protein